MNEKTVKLKNGKMVKIQLLTLKDKYAICATDEHDNIISKCVFAIFQRKISKHAKSKKYTVKDVNILDGSATCKISDSAADLKEATFCKLDSIEILDERYFKVGLGSEMLKNMETFAKTQDCKNITGWFYPNGNFWYGAKDFYLKNNFTFSDENGKVILNKDISPKMTNSQNKNSSLEIK